MIKDIKYLSLHSKWFFLFSLTFLWVLIAVLVNPIGEFPLNDDWAYSRNVYNLAVNGVFRFDNWPAMTLLAQTLWGAFFCKIFGFSFTVLRMSVLIAGWAGLITFFLLVRKIVLNDILALVYCLILAFDPFYFSLSNTFMTEVPFLTAILGALYFYFRFYEKEKIKFLILATAFALIATMIRQQGVMIAIAMFLTTLVTGKIKLKQIILQIFLAGFVVVFLFGFTSYLEAKHLLPTSYGSFSKFIKLFTWVNFMRNLYFRTSILLFYSGILLLPLVIYILPSYYRRVRPVFRWISGTISVLFSIPIIQNIRNIPCGNIIYNLGLGPKLVKDDYYGFNHHPVLSQDTMLVIDMIGILGVVLLMYAFILAVIVWKRKMRSTSVGKIKVQILFMISGYIGFLLISDNFFDRYLLPAILFFILLLTSSEIKVQKWNLALSFLIFLCLAFFSVSATHDYLAFNRARWKGLKSMMAVGISPHHIDGGFEFNSWYEPGNWSWPATWGQKSWWRVDDDTYLISTGYVSGYNKIATFKYTSFLEFAQDSVLILNRSHSCSDLCSDSTVIMCGAETLSKNGDYFLTSVNNIKLEDTYGRTDSEARTGKYAVLLNGVHPFGFNYTFKNVKPCEKFRVSIWCKYNRENKAGIVVRAKDANLLYVWSNIPIKSVGGWELLETEVHLNKGFPSSEVSICIYNTGKSNVLFDDLTITRYMNP